MSRRNSTREQFRQNHLNRRKNLSTIGAIHTEFTKNEKASSEWHYYISSRKLTPEELLKHARLEWTVESMHWLLDVHFPEDKTKVMGYECTTNFKYYAKNSFEFSKRIQKPL